MGNRHLAPNSHPTQNKLHKKKGGGAPDRPVTWSDPELLEYLVSMFTNTENLLYTSMCLNYTKHSLNQQHNRTVGQASVVTEATYRRSNSTKSPASAAGIVSETRLTSQVGRVREVV